jgi:prolipoprotein diacylglyceryltransferase
MEKYRGTIEDIHYEKASNDSLQLQQGVPMQIRIQFARKIKDENVVRQFGNYLLAEDLSRYDYDNNVFLLQGDTLNYTVEKKDRRFWLVSTIGGLPRHPTQIYEAGSYLLIFLFLFCVFHRYETRLKNGFIFGIFLFLVFSARFIIEFVKENQETFEDAMSLNMGQILSIPFVIIGLSLIIWKWPQKSIQS